MFKRIVFAAILLAIATGGIIASSVAASQQAVACPMHDDKTS